MSTTIDTSQLEYTLLANAPHHELGRNSHIESGALLLFWTGSGLETIYAGEELWLDIEAHSHVYEQWISVTINGEPVIRTALADGRTSLCVLRGHSSRTPLQIRVLKEVQFMHDDPDATLIIHGFYHARGTFVKPAQHTLRFEFIGDSITSGTGAVGGRLSSSYCSYIFSAQHAYPRMVADAYGADFRIISQAGWGITCNCENDPRCTLPSIYDATCALASREISEHTSPSAHSFYSFEDSPADAIIINLGTNDATAFLAPAWSSPDKKRDFSLTLSEDGIPDARSRTLIIHATIAFLHTVREHNPHALILWAYGMMNTLLSDILSDAVHAYAAEYADDLVQYVQLPQCTGPLIGAFEHPNEKGHAAAAETLCTVIKDYLEEHPQDTV